MNPLLHLQVLDHREQVTRLGITFWTEHAHEALARLVEDLGELLESDRRVASVTQHSLASIDITGEQAFAPFLQQALALQKATNPMGDGVRQARCMVFGDFTV